MPAAWKGGLDAIQNVDDLEIQYEQWSRQHTRSPELAQMAAQSAPQSGPVHSDIQNHDRQVPQAVGSTADGQKNKITMVPSPASPGTSRGAPLWLLYFYAALIAVLAMTPLFLRRDEPVRLVRLASPVVELDVGPVVEPVAEQELKQTEPEPERTVRRPIVDWANASLGTHIVPDLTSGPLTLTQMAKWYQYLPAWYFEHRTPADECDRCWDPTVLLQDCENPQWALNLSHANSLGVGFGRPIRLKAVEVLDKHLGAMAVSARVGGGVHNGSVREPPASLGQLPSGFVYIGQGHYMGGGWTRMDVDADGENGLEVDRVLIQFPAVPAVEFTGVRGLRLLGEAV